MAIKSELKNKRVTVVGLGLHGGAVGTIKFLAENGAKVLVTDIKKREELEPSIQKLRGLKIEYVLGQHRPEDFIEPDLIIRNPAVPKNFKYFDLARKNKVKITSDVGLFFDYCQAPICAVTGTKGKSTTASLIAEILPVVLAGNIGISPLSKLQEIRPESIVVLELSSVQLEEFAENGARPHVAVITNVTQDHLDRHANLTEYQTAKKLIFKNQKKTDYLVLNYDDAASREFAAEAKSRVYYFSRTRSLKDVIAEESRYEIGAYLAGELISMSRGEETVLKIQDLPLRGAHNIENALAAVTAAKILGAANKDIEKAVKSFKPLHSRLEEVALVSGVKFINDTTATNPSALAAALKTVGEAGARDIVLIAGGADKKLSFEPTLESIGRRCKAVILLAGEASSQLNKLLDEKQLVPHLTVQSMREAVEEAARRAEKGDIVLLSPGASSFNMFLNEFDRGAQFVDEVKKLKSKS